MPPSVLNQVEFSKLFYGLKEEGVLPGRLGMSEFLRVTTNEKLFEKAEITHVGKANATRKKFVRYSHLDPSVFSIALSLRSRSYISHVSALFLHGVTEQLPKTIFVNKEQSAKDRNGQLAQGGIDRAFSRAARRSQYIWAWKGSNSRITMLNGKQTHDYGVIDLDVGRGEMVRVTNWERTLVDIVVRPTYSGGVLEILKAYRELKGRVSVDRIIETLSVLDYTYPYQQSVGFAMQKAGFPASSLEKIRALGIDYDFYFDYKMRNTEFDSAWRIHVPKGI